ncbi:hypothetical protein [Bradyrhizobium sp. SZCCHNRI20481]|uniref:ATP-grasp domain-containing protein n=1 Tax=Bradyrhizobium sp. SZCCHNRI20481 TaxID=3057286 RepID=UPI00291699E1|nr:hypothetical protein [Bradyrhizobium sp. SZCCHNRI20481]
MKNFYWIDSFNGYPETMDDVIRTSLETYNGLYGAYTKALGYKFRLVHLEDLDIASGEAPIVQHKEYGNILAQDGAAYVGLIHPDLQMERKQELLYRLIANSANVRLLNYTSKFPMVCKDKFRGLDIARKLGLQVLPTALLGPEGSTPPQMDFAERTVGSYPMFIRPLDLTSGLGKKVINDRVGLRRYFENPPFSGRLYIVQPCVSIEAEYRVYLDGYEIVACRRREPLENGKLCTVPDAILEGSRTLAKYLETTYLCVDWLWNGSEFWFCEFETGGGFSELSEPHCSRVAAAFFRKLAT